MSDTTSPPPPGVWSRLRRNPKAMIVLGILIAVIYFAVDGPRWFAYHPQDTSKAQFHPPSEGHPFGTDLNGRDQLSRVVQGARISLLVGFCGALISFAVGTTYGMVSGYFGGKTDELMMRGVDILYSIPRLLIIIIAVYSF